MMRRRKADIAGRQNLGAVLKRSYLGMTLFSVCFAGISVTALAMLALRSSSNYSLHMIARSMITVCLSIFINSRIWNAANTFHLAQLEIKLPLIGICIGNITRW
ncbi:hypothetical protein [Rhodanobacter sp. L36]|uniref:hypothetical protein n=1 Tax=Rhodanobacter sp. L36 TaxID=1747221 RepID=UPI00131C64B4|nr:hypothetical protein [Rhodanobacter sp. L36]